MKVLINGRYAYETDLEDVEVGDEMVLPGDLPGSWTGIVTTLEPAYDRPCRKAIGLSRRREQVQAEHAALAQVEISGWTVGQTISKRCDQCGKERLYVVEAVNNLGRPTSLKAAPCDCGAPGRGTGLGSAESFRHFMIDPAW
ncbi:MAG: hypothetical protein ABW196_06710 [Solirubrobacterales bacterium]